MVDAGRNVVPVGTGAEEERDLAGRHVAARQPRQLALDGELRRVIGKPLDAVRQPRPLRHVDEQIVDRGSTDRGEHLLAVAVRQG
jgi:hypothetical protein